MGENGHSASDMSDTANSDKNSAHAKRIRHLKPFPKGVSGNPSGRPKKKPITELYDKILSDPRNIKKLRAAIETMIFSGRMAGQLQLREMAERVEGKVTQPVEVNGELNLTLSERFSRAKELKEKALHGGQ